MPDTYCSAVIAKLLGFTFAMITLPIGTYFLTVNTIFSGIHQFISTDKISSTSMLRLCRELDLCWWNSSRHGERGVDRLCDCGDERGSIRSTRGRGKGEKVKVIDHGYPIGHLSAKHMQVVVMRYSRFYEIPRVHGCLTISLLLLILVPNRTPLYSTDSSVKCHAVL